VVYDVFDITVLCTNITLDEHGLVEFVAQQVVDLSGKFIDGDLVLAQVEVSVARDSYHDYVVLIGCRHIGRVLSLRHFDGERFLQHRRDHHEDDKHDEHHVNHRRNVDFDVYGTSAAASSHTHGDLPSAFLLDEVINQLRRRVR